MQHAAFFMLVLLNGVDVRFHAFARGKGAHAKSTVVAYWAIEMLPLCCRSPGGMIRVWLWHLPVDERRSRADFMRTVC